MGALGGSVKEMSIKGRIFAVAGDADITYDIGGFSVENQMNGDGTVRPISTVKPWKAEGVPISLDKDNDDLGFLQDVMDSREQVAITVTFVDDTTRAGRGGVTGDLAGSSQSGTASVNVGGGGKFELQ